MVFVAQNAHKSISVGAPPSESTVDWFSGVDFSGAVVVVNHGNGIGHGKAGALTVKMIDVSSRFPQIFYDKCVNCICSPESVIIKFTPRRSRCFEVSDVPTPYTAADRLRYGMLAHFMSRQNTSFIYFIAAQ